MNISAPRIVVAGCGGIARAHLGALAPDSVVALCDSNPANAHRLAGEFGLNAPIYGSLEDALATRPNIALICTPPTTHCALASLVLRAGAHVLCEKPLATRAADARVLVELARERGLRLRTGAKYRFARGVVAAKTWLEAGDLGDLKSLDIAFGAPFNWSRSWHADLKLSGGGVWMDNGPHALDLARFLAGELEVPSIETWKTENDVETEIKVHLRAQEVAVTIALSWERGLGENFAVLECQRGTLFVGWKHTRWQPQSGAARELAGAYDKSACFAASWRGFSGDDARWNAGDGARVVELLETVYQSAPKSG